MRIFTSSIVLVFTFFQINLAKASAPSYYSMSSVPCFFMTSGMMTPVCAATMGTMWMMNASMSMGPMAFLSAKVQTDRAIEFKKHLNELAEMGVLDKVDVDSISQDILRKMGKKGCTFDLSALENSRLTDSEKIVFMAMKNNVSPETIKYLSGIQGINLAD